MFHVWLQAGCQSVSRGSTTRARIDYSSSVTSGRGVPSTSTPVRRSGMQIHVDSRSEHVVRRLEAQTPQPPSSPVPALRLAAAAPPTGQLHTSSTDAVARSTTEEKRGNSSGCLPLLLCLFFLLLPLLLLSLLFFARGGVPGVLLGWSELLYGQASAQPQQCAPIGPTDTLTELFVPCEMCGRNIIV